MSAAPSKLYVPEGIIPGEPTWDVTRLFPTQGNWSESDYLALDTNQPVEFSLSQKREEYAQAGIPEYWIVDPELGQIIVLTLEDRIYVVHGEFKRGDQATSKLLPGFAVDVTSALEPKR